MRETQILRGLHKARATMGHNYADGYAPGAMDLRRGVAKLKGPGTTTSDSIPANLSRGEAVLPAKTVQKVGAGNIARLIEQTNGKPPARGLRAGGKHAAGAIPGMEVTEFFEKQSVPTLEEARARVQAQPKPPLGNTTTLPPTSAAPVAEAPKPNGLWNQAKHYGSKAVGATGDVVSGAKAAPMNGLKALGKVGLAAAPVAGAVGAVMDSDANVKRLADSTGLDYGSDAGRIGANVVNFLDKTGNAATFGLAGKLGTALSNKMNGGSFFDGAPTPTTAAPAQPAAPVQPAPAAPASPAAGNPYADANAAKLAAASAPQAPSIHVERQPNGVMSFSNTADTGQNNYTGPGAAGLRRGNMNVMPAFKGDGGTTSDADLATMRANLRDGVALSRGTPQGVPGGVTGFNGSGSQWEKDKNAWNASVSASSTTSNSGLSARQAANLQQQREKMAQDRELGMADVGARREGNYLQSDTSLKTAAMQRDASMYGHEVSRDNSLRGNQVTREGNALQFAGTQNRLKFDIQQKGLDRQEQGAKSFDEFVKNDPSTFVDDPKNPGGPKVHDPSRAAALSKYLAETVPGIDDGQGGAMSLQQAFAVNNPAARDAAQKASNEMSLREFANRYSKEAPLGKGTDAGRVVVKGAPRPSELADLAKNMHATDYIATKMPWVNDRTVEIGGLGGRSIAVPLKDIINAPNGREMLEALNRLSASK